MAILNFLVPILSWVFVLTDNSMALNECLGKGYLNFLPTKNHYCTNDDILCWVWFGLVSIMMSDIIDFYCLYQCIKNIKKSTVESRYMLSKKAYTNRKRYGALIVIPMQCLHCIRKKIFLQLSTCSIFKLLMCYLFILIRDNGITIQIMAYQLYTEVLIFLTMFGYFLIPIDHKALLHRINGILTTFVMFVILPLFYLNGDVNFRNRVLHQGFWNALKKELFLTHTEIQTK